MGSTYNTRGDPRTPWMKLRAFLTIFGGLLIHLALGGQYTFEPFNKVCWSTRREGVPFVVLIENRYLHQHIVKAYSYYVAYAPKTPWSQFNAYNSRLMMSPDSIGKGNVMPYLISYLKYRAGEQNVRNVDSLWFNTATAPLQVVAFMLGGVLHRRFGPRITTAIGSVIYSASTFLTYFAVQKSFIALAFTQSMVGPLGTTIAYGGSLAVAMQWFPQRSGLAGGIILAGFGGSSSIINQIITFYINPDNLPPDVKEGSERYFSDVALLNRVPSCYLILGGMYTVLQIFGVLLLFSPPSSDKNKLDIIVTYNKTSNTNFDENEKTENKDREASVDDSTIKQQQKHTHVEMKQLNFTEEVEEGNAKSERASSGGTTQADRTVLQLIKQMVMSRNFYIFSIVLFSVGYGNLTITTLYKVYGQTFILDDHFLALVGSLSSVFNCVGRPFWGAIMDRFRFKVAIQCITAGSACLLMTIIASEWVGKTLFATWVCATYFCMCGTYSTVPAILSKLYGVSNLGITYGLTRIATIATAIISAVMGTTLRDVIGWHGVYILGGGVTALGFVASFFFIDEDSEQNQKD